MNFTKKALRSLYAADWTNGFEYENMLLGIKMRRMKDVGTFKERIRAI